jgi:hypothetical protein
VFSTTWGVCFRSRDNSKRVNNSSFGTVLGQRQSAEGGWLPGRSARGTCSFGAGRREAIGCLDVRVRRSRSRPNWLLGKNGSTTVGLRLNRPCRRRGRQPVALRRRMESVVYVNSRAQPVSSPELTDSSTREGCLRAGHLALRVNEAAPGSVDRGAAPITHLRTQLLQDS